MIPTMKKLAAAGVAAVALTSVAALGTAQAQSQNDAANKNAPAQGQERTEARGDRAANSECVASIHDMQANYRDSNVRYDPELRADVRTLREAAYTLAYNGDEDGCRWMLQKIEEVRTNARKNGADTAELQERRMERLDEAESLTGMKGAVRAEMLMGADVVNMQDEDLGAVEDVILNSEGNPSYVLISHGGLFGIGDNLTPVSMEQLKKIQGEDTLVLDIAEERFEAAPEYDEEAARTTGLDAWSQDIENWWDENTG
ncbi:PRC-barrel domain-containing protein [Minwuia thermotolerans]|nr:PRC-barrel domain-containing protein [Minwuia thermotolerans]